MGQYFKAVNTDLNEGVAPATFRSGSKLTEHSWVGNDAVDLVCTLMLKGERWHKTRLVWAGDYAGIEFTEDYAGVAKAYKKKYAIENGEEYLNEINLYSICKIAKFTMAENTEKVYYYIESRIRYGFNVTKKEYYDISMCPSSSYGEDYMLHPLPLLTASGNGTGGGDYYGKNGIELVGTWANDIIFTSNELPENIDEYIEIKPHFRE